MKESKNAAASSPPVPVAIVGMGCIFPKSPNLKEYWRLIWRGQDAIGPVPPTHWSAADYYDPDPKRPDHVYCQRGGFIDSVQFDPTEFGLPPSILEATDTSQLLSLVATRMALTDAGYGEGQRPFDRQRTGVVIGVTGTQELVIPLGARLGYPKWRQAMHQAGIDPQAAEKAVALIADSYVEWQEASFPGLLGNVVAGRISNRFDLGGINCAVDAACASSFSALNLALLELWAGRSEMVLTGGADLLNDIFMHMCFAKTHILSTSGDARPFSKDADGTVLGEGVGILVLKRLVMAERDKDRIYAVIRGIGTASDGRSSSIYAPRIEGQSLALERAYQSAGIDPGSIDLVEAHGTGTRVGDQVEFKALCRIFDHSARSTNCALGSVKSMIGHTKAAAGAAGLIKAALALYHKVLPPTIKVGQPDPSLGLDASPFSLNTTARPWVQRPGHPRRCGVSAFGFGGSNFHIVLEEHRPTRAAPAWDHTRHILAFDALDQPSLKDKVAALRRTLGMRPDPDTVCTEAHRSCTAFDAAAPWRIVGVIETATAATSLTALETALDNPLTPKTRLPARFFWGKGPAPGKLAVLFPGQGSQYPYMGRDLVCVFPQALAALEATAAHFEGDVPLADLVYPPTDFAADAAARQSRALQATDRAQPAIGAVSLGWYRVLTDFGLVPDAAAGHSFGELTALAAAGFMDEPTFLRLAVARGKAMADAGCSGTDTGAMLAVKAPLADLDALSLPDPALVLANRNSPTQGVFAGPSPAIEQLENECRSRGWRTVRLPVAAAFHSALIRKAHKPFRRAIEAAAFQEGGLPVYGNTRAAPYPADSRGIGQTLGDQMLRPVDFVGMVERLYADGIRIFLEVGPKRVLGTLAGEILGRRPHTVLAVDRSNGRGCGVNDLALTLAQLAAMGIALNLSGWEQPPTTRRPARMQVTLSGANHRSRPASERPAAPPADGPAANGMQSRNHASSDAPATSATRAVPSCPPGPRTTRPTPAPTDRPNPMKATDQQPSQTLIAEALKSVQAGLKAIEAMQTQTAQAHQKFLDVQQEASRALQQMISSTRQVSQALLGNEAAAQITPLPAPPPPCPEPIRATSRPASAPAPQPAAAAAPNPKDHFLMDAVVAVVSGLTGYPKEMLSPEMDIEADLGIDSIKRVEILSTLEERVPGLPAIAPEQMAAIKTLGDIAAVLSPNAAQQDAPPQSPAAAAPPETARPAAAPLPEPTGSALMDAVVAVVSGLTGYPKEMLSPEMDIEADLGIDSIKRVEILSTLEERVPGLPAVAPEQMAAIKTLGDIAAVLSPGGQATGTTPPEAAKPAAGPAMAAHDGTSRSPDPAEPELPAPRQVIRTRPCPSVDGPALELAVTGQILVAGADDLGPALVRALTENGRNADYLDAERISAALGDGAGLPRASGLVWIAPAQADADRAYLKRAFAFTRRLAGDLTAAAENGGALLATVSRLDGAFGFLQGPLAVPSSGALAGLVKTAAQEFDAVACRALDIGPDWPDVGAAARAIARELTFLRTDDPVEIGLSADGGRHRLELETMPYVSGPLDLAHGDIVVVSGGARGVTAEALLALAREVKPTCIILGRSPLPGDEPEWLAGLSEPAAIQQAILTHELAGRQITPRQLAERARGIGAQKEIRRNLARLARVGATVAYHSVDVRRADELARILDRVRTEHGPIRALIHGAGTLHDRRIADKTDRQFDAVFDTKVEGLFNLLDLTAEDPLRHIVLFSSVAARMGNPGQADYAMANELLNKTAQHLARQRPETRVLSINWGPWNGGMVDCSLKRHFESKGIELLDPVAGAAAMVRAMADPITREAEIVVGSGLAPAEIPTDDLQLAFDQEVDLETYPVLADHVLGGRPVVPLALMMEWLGHTALHANPGLSLVAIEELRLLNGIKLDGRPHPVRLMNGPSVPRQGLFEVPVVLFNGNGCNGSGRVHSRARALLADAPAPAPAADAPLVGLTPFPLSVADAYAEVLFHGKRLHGIRHIDGSSAQGMVARLAPAPAPHCWIRQPLRSRWVTDPLILDAAFQMAILWGYAQHGMVSLPSYAASYRQYCRRFPPDGVTGELRVREVTARKLRADFTFLDDRRQVMATLAGYEATMDPSLSQAFKQRRTA